MHRSLWIILLQLSLLGASACKKKAETTPPPEESGDQQENDTFFATTYTMSEGIRLARNAVMSAAIESNSTSIPTEQLACDGNSKGGFASCLTEFAWWAKQTTTYPPNFLDKKREHSIFALFDNHLFLVCLVHTAIDAKTGEDTDSIGYPKDGSYSFGISDFAASSVTETCGLDSTSWAAFQQKAATYKFQIDLSTLTDDTIYDKKMVLSVNDETEVKIEYLFSYSDYWVSFLMRRLYKTSPSLAAPNAVDRSLFYLDFDNNVTSFEWLSPAPVGASADLSLTRGARLFVGTDTRMIYFSQPSSGTGGLSYTAAYKGSRPGSVSLSVQGGARDLEGPGNPFQFNAQKSGCLKADFTAIVGTDAVTDCNKGLEPAAEYLDSVAVSAALAGAKGLKLTSTTLGSLLPLGEKIGLQDSEEFTESSVWSRVFKVD